MVRIIGFVIGLGFAGVLLISLVVNLVEYVQSPPEPTAEHEFHRRAKDLKLSSDGPFGRFDPQQLQRGFQGYKEVCAGCHSLSLVSFREPDFARFLVKALGEGRVVAVERFGPGAGIGAVQRVEHHRIRSPGPNRSSGTIRRSPSVSTTRRATLACGTAT